MTDQDAAAPASADDADADEVATDAVEPPPRRGTAKRRKLGGVIEKYRNVTGTTDMMVTHDQRYAERLLLQGEGLTDRGGPADVVLDLVRDWVRAIKAVNPGANPVLERLVPTSSMEIVLHPPDEEIVDAGRRQAYFEDTDSLDVALPETTLAIAAITTVLTAEPEAGAEAARTIGVTAADAIRDLAADLADREIEATIGLGSDSATKIEPEHLLRVVEQLDATSELPPVTVTVVGVLNGANSRGDGQFEIETDAQVQLDPAFGRRKKAGDVVQGALTPKARREIRKDNLWDRHVEARVQLVRRQRGPKSTRIESVRLMSVSPRPGYSSEELED
ncbi:MAG: hypothetical protein JHC84_02115 [Solirubrobacteraceae bacterium]|nr:hypothetical protein [Solirubrobacteraceae bacterium]